MKKFFKNSFNILFFVCITYLMINILMNSKLNNIEKKISKISIKKYMFFIVFFIMIFLQMIAGYLFKVLPSWDFGTVYMEGINPSFQIQNLTYFCRFPNNMPTAYLLKIIFLVIRLFKIKDYLYVGMVINIFCIDISILMTILTVKEMLGKENAFFSLIFMAQMSVFYLIVPIFYTDTFSMPFAISQLYIFLKFRKAENQKKKILYSMCLSIFAFLGMNIKVTVGVCFVAIMIYEIFLNEESNLKQMIYPCISIVSLVLLIFFEMLLFKYHCEYIERIDNERFGFYHYLMMSASMQGGYNDLECEYTASFPTKEEKKEADITRYKEKMKNFNTVKSFLALVTNKEIEMWGVGTYYIPQLLFGNKIRTGPIQKLVYGENNKLYIYFSQVQRISMIVLIWLSIFYRDKSYLNKSINTILRLATLGFIIFFTFWEVAPRYIIHFLPIFIVLQIFGLETCEQIFSDLKNIDISKLKSLNFNKKE